ncbi:MAG: hypothetical protein ACI9TZ_003411, partial [Yoonia sp.]
GREASANRPFIHLAAFDTLGSEPPFAARCTEVYLADKV